MKSIDWKDPACCAIGGCFVIECGLNILGAYDFLGGWDGAPKSHGVALGGGLIAFLGAWCGREGAGKAVRDGWGVWPLLMVTVAVLVFALSQFAGWRVLGVSFSDGALRREVAGDDLQNWRDERRKIGVTRPKAQVEAELDLELRRTSKQFPSGDGPKATALKGELGSIVRAAELEAKIGKAGSRGMVQAGAENAIAHKMFGLTKDDAQLLLVVAFTALIGFFANFGFMLREIVGGPRGGDGDGGFRRAPEESWRDFGRRVGEHTQRMMERAVPLPMLAAPAAVQGAPPGAPGGGASQGVTINIGRDGYQLRDPGGLPAEPGAGERIVAPRAAQTPPRVDFDGLPADAPPIDRSGVQRALSDEERPVADVMLAFRAACVIPAPGGLVSIENLYNRYRHWAGERAADAAVFRVLFPEVTSVRLVEIGGFLHAQDVALRLGAALKVA